MTSYFLLKNAETEEFVKNFRISKQYVEGTLLPVVSYTDSEILAHHYFDFKSACVERDRLNRLMADVNFVGDFVVVGVVL